MMDIPDLENRFTYHSPDDEDIDKYQLIRGIAKDFAFLLTQHVPEGRELEIAVRKLEEAVFWANAGIARSK